METLAYPATFGLMITLLCQITLVVNYQIILRKNNNESTPSNLVYTCQVDDPELMISWAEFYCRSQGQFLPLAAWNQSNIYANKTNLNFLITKLDEETLKKCNEFSCSGKISVDDLSDFSNLSNPITLEILELEERLNTTNIVETQPEEPKVTNTMTIKKRVNVTDVYPYLLIFTCSIEPETTEFEEIRWFRNGKYIHLNTNHEVYIIPLPALREDERLEGTSVCEVILKGGYPQRSNELDLRWLPTPNTNTTFATAEIIYSEITLKPDKRVKLKDIREHDHLNLHCYFSLMEVTIVRTIWRRNGEEEFNDVAQEVYRVGSDLHLRFIRPNATGSYICEVITTFSKKIFRSKPVQIFVKDDNYVSKDGPNVYFGIFPSTGHFFCDIQPNNYDALLENRSGIQWMKDTNRLILDEGMDLLKNDSFLVIIPLKISSTGVYSCQVELANGDIIRSNNRQLIVKSEPTYLSYHPAKMVEMIPYVESVVEDAAIRFECRVYPNTTVESTSWYRDDWDNQIYPDNDRIQSFGNVLLIDGVRKSDVGRYICDPHIYQGYQKGVGTCYVGANITYVADAPDNPDIEVSGNITKVEMRLENSLDKYVAYDGDTLYFTCTVEPDTTNVRQIRWKYKGALMEKSTDFDCYYLFRNFTAVVDKIKLTAMGSYHCEVETKDGKTIESKPLQIFVEKRKITMDNPSAYFLIPDLRQYPDRVVEGDNITMYCSVFPEPKIITERNWYQWYLNGTRINSTVLGGSNVSEGRRLKIDNIRKSHMGNYTCELVITMYNRTYTSVPLPRFEVKTRLKEQKTNTSTNENIGIRESSHNSLSESISNAGKAISEWWNSLTSSVSKVFS